MQCVAWFAQPGACPLLGPWVVLLSVLEEHGELPQVVAEAGGLAFRERGHFLLERRF